MRTPSLILALLLSACVVDPDTHEELPGTGGFLHVECPAGYMCEPYDDGSCFHQDMTLAPSGLCSYHCSTDEDCPALKGATCVDAFMCGTVCQDDADCADAGYDEGVRCWETPVDGIFVCANPPYEVLEGLDETG